MNKMCEVPALLVLLTSCQTTIATTGSQAPKQWQIPVGASSERAAPASEVAITTASRVTLGPQSLSRAWVAFDGIAGVAPDRTDWDVGGVFYQGRQWGEERFEILVRAHGDESLEAFERDKPGYSFSDRTSPIVCGKPARAVRASRPEEDIACVVAGGGNHPAHIPSTEISAVELEHRGLRVVLTVSVATVEHETYRPLVEQVIRSIRCL